jgi:hypothetical protein
VFGGIGEDAQCAHDRKTTAFRLPTAVSFIDEQSIRRKFLSQRNCGALTGAEPFINGNKIASWALNLNSIRRPGNPLLHDRWRPFSTELGDGGRWNDDTSVENREDVAVLDENQVPERTGVRWTPAGDNRAARAGASGW